MTENKRFKITKSKLVQNAYVIEDKEKQFTFPTLVGDKRGLIGYEKALNKLSEQNASIKGRIIDAMVKSNQVECNCSPCVCEDYVNEELTRW